MSSDDDAAGFVGPLLPPPRSSSMSMPAGRLSGGAAADVDGASDIPLKRDGAAEGVPWPYIDGAGAAAWP
jgi:hypothetical protein